MNRFNAPLAPFQRRHLQPYAFTDPGSLGAFAENPKSHAGGASVCFGWGECGGACVVFGWGGGD